MKRLKIKFRSNVTLTVHPAGGQSKKIAPDRLRVKRGTVMHINGIVAYVDKQRIERCNLTMLGGNQAVGVKYASFRFLD